jgi:hypothetical protein
VDFGEVLRKAMTRDNRTNMASPTGAAPFTSNGKNGKWVASPAGFTPFIYRARCCRASSSCLRGPFEADR